MHWSRKYLFLLIFLTPCLLHGQVKDEFDDARTQDSLNRKFVADLILLDKVMKKGVDSSKVDSLRSTGEFSFLSRKLSAENKVILVLDLVPAYYEAYMETERQGKINTLKVLRATGRLKVYGRTVANEVELPKKTNRNQSYNDFYLEVIRQLLQKNRSVLANDQLDFAMYQSWEKSAGLVSELAVRHYRESFILFIYKHYHVN